MLFGHCDIATLHGNTAMVKWGLYLRLLDEALNAAGCLVRDNDAVFRRLLDLGHLQGVGICKKDRVGAFEVEGGRVVSFGGKGQEGSHVRRHLHSSVGYWDLGNRNQCG